VIFAAVNTSIRKYFNNIAVEFFCAHPEKAWNPLIQAFCYELCPALVLDCQLVSNDAEWFSR
jgi:hypothetical protein